MFNIDLKSTTPIYEQLYNKIVRLTSLNVLKVDEKIPSVRSLAKRLQVNPNTVQKAYQLLERDNVIYTFKGKGSYIASRENALDIENRILMIEANDILAKLYDSGTTKQQAIEIVDKFYQDREESSGKGRAVVD